MSNYKDKYGVVFSADRKTLKEAPKTLHGEYIIPDSVKEIGDEAFNGCANLTSITIPRNVTKISRCAFCECSSLTSITIPGSVKEIGRGTFAGCTALSSITIPSSVTEIGACAFYGCNALSSITIPCSVTEIEGSTFGRCISLTSITIPDSVTEIGSGAFQECTALTSITIPDSVKEIGKEAFARCTGLTSITIPDSVTEISDFAFDGCKALSDITIPESVTEIGDYAFVNCPNLTAVWRNKLLLAPNHGPIPDGVTTIGERALEETRRTIISLPPSVTTIEKAAFRNAEALSILTLPPSVDSIAKNALSGCQQLKMLQAPVCAIKCLSGTGSHDTAVVIRNAKPTSLPERAFADISTVGSVTLTDTISGIDDEAFVQCSGLRALAITASVKRLGSRFFAGNPLLETIHLGWTDRLPDADLGEIDYSRVRLIVPAGTTALYRASVTWGRFTQIEES